MLMTRRPRAWLAAFLGLLPVVFVWLACSSTPARQPEAPAPGQAALRLMTYNLNYGLTGDTETLAAVRAGGAEIVLLQETTPEWETQLTAKLSKEFPHRAFRHCCGAGGLGVLSKHPFTEAEYIPPPGRGWFPAWRLLFDSPIGKLQVLSVHLRPQIGDSGGIVSGYFTTPSVRAAEIEEYFARLDPELATIIAGDFNEQRGGRALDFLAEQGYRSALSEFRPAAKTWRWQTSFGRIQREFDHLVYGPGLRPLSAEVLEAGRSDHLPVVAVFVRS
jgi:endonuclease/exonuclease/phosphatase (EEP) superfamily protein YafD